MAEDLGTLIALQFLLLVPADAGNCREAVQLLSVYGETVDPPIPLAHLEGGKSECVLISHIIS
jgi:hypothetical protein